MLPKLNFSLIGCGKIAQRHAKHINKIGNLVGVYDIIPSKATVMAEAYNCISFTSVGEMLKPTYNTDVVVVCTPNGLHATHTIQALQNGYHVVCEKPLALSVADGEAMAKAAEAANKKIFLVKQNRYNPPVAELKKLLTNNTLGNVLSVQLNCFWHRDAAYYNDDWHGTISLDGGILYTQFSHFIDLLYWYFGTVNKVYAINKNSKLGSVIEFEDNGVVALQFTSGVLGTIHYTINSHASNMEGSLTVFGDKGTVKIGGQYLNTIEYQNIDRYVIDDLPQGNTANNYGAYTGSMSNHDKVYANVINALQNGMPIATTVQDGIETVRIIEQIYEAAKK